MSFPSCRTGAPLLALVLALALDLGASAAQANEPFAPGRYAIKAQTVMPHLEEMRRLHSDSVVCSDGRDFTGLFPVLSQPALRGCEVTRVSADDLLLRCLDQRVATGDGHWRRAATGNLHASLDIKMGGKNMTFSHHVVATHEGPCLPR